MGVQVPQNKAIVLPLTISSISHYPLSETPSQNSSVEMALVKRLGAERAVVIFSKSTCCMCHTIKTLICSFGANPMVYELDEHPNGQQMEKELKALGSKPSVPAVFIGQELIGGSNEIMSLHLKGKLVPLLKKANAIWV